MTLSSARSRHARNYAWIVIAHIVGGLAIGGLEAARLGSVRLALVLLPVFAATGLVVGLACAFAERLVGRQTEMGRWWLAAVVVAAPSLAISVPVCATLFDGAHAQTLPLASALPILAPLAIWLGTAIALAIGRRLARGDLMMRAIAIIGTTLVLGGVVWTKRLLGSGYGGAQIGATLVVIVLAGVVLRCALRARPSAYAAAALASIVTGMAVAASSEGLVVEADRRQLAIQADHGRDLVRLWRTALDFDNDGSSALLGGGDCDDRDSTRNPGATDLAGDGIDQDCDGEDAIVIAAPAPPPPEADQVEWRSTVEPTLLLERTKAMNVILITVDALRFDMLAPDAPYRDDFPRLVKFLDESVFFTRAFAPASGTDVSLGTLLTGRHDPFQQVDVTLGEAVRSLGLTTTSAMPSEVLRHVGDIMLGRGFDRVRKVHTDWGQEDIGDHISSDETTAETLRNITAAKGKRFFTWAHYFDVHEHHQITAPSELRRAVNDGGSPNVHSYRAMVLAVDRAVGKLLDELEQRGLADTTIIVFASDHGESLKEDPRLLDTHGIVAYGPLVRIPIAFRVPGVKPARRLEPVTLVDLAPTLLDLLGASHAMGALDGWSLVPSLLDAPAELRPAHDRALVIHEEQQWAVVEWPYQLLVKPADDFVELYDLDHDPFVKNDLAARLPDVTRRLRARYAAAPRVRVDRSLDGRAWREQRAQPPPRRARP